MSPPQHPHRAARGQTRRTSSWTGPARCRRGSRRAFLGLGLGLGLALMVGGPARAAGERVRVQVRVIEASRTANGPKVDRKLQGLAKDLASLPFQRFRLIDAHTQTLGPDEKVSLEFPGSEKQRRFLKVKNHGPQRGGKLAFQLQIPELQFDTRVAVPDGGTILVGGPRHGKDTLIFAVTAQRPTGRSGPGRQAPTRPRGRRR